MRTPALLFLLALAALALVLRWMPAADLELARSERDLAPSRFLIDDPHSAYHARRIELALAGERAPRFDRYLNHPQGSEIPWSPLYDTALAAIAQRGLRESGADPALGGVEEPRLEEFLVRVPPLFGALVAAAVFWAVSRIAEGKRRIWCAFFAALVVAVAPISVAQDAAGHLDHLSWIALLVALQIAVSVRALRTDEALASVFGALVTGILVGLELTSFALGLALFVGNWAAYLVLSFTGSEERRRLGSRSGLLFCAVAAFVGRLTLSEGPWEGAREGVMNAWSESTCALALLASIPFILGFLLTGRRSSKYVQTAIFVVALGALFYNAPEMLRGLSRGLNWYRGNRELLMALAPGHQSLAADPQRLEWIFLLTPACLAFVPAWWFLKRRWKEPEYALLLVLGAVTLVLFLFERRLGGLFVVPMACTLGAALDVALEGEEGRARRIARWIAGAAVAVSIAHAVAPWLKTRESAQREERIEFVKGLRWMRENTPSPGAWNAPTGPNDWGVITTPGAAHLVEYHARRPTVGSDLALISGTEDLGDVSRALLDENPAPLLHCLRSTRSRYVVVGPRMLNEAPALEQSARAGAPHPEHGTGALSDTSLLARLALTRADDDGKGITGLERVYASPRRVNRAGHAPETGEPSGPAISIYRSTEAALTPPNAELKAR